MQQWGPPAVREWTRARVDDGIAFTWSGITFATRHLDGESPQWGVEDTTWWDGATLDSEELRAARGVLVGQEHYQPRVVSWSGLLETWSRDELIEQMQALQTAKGTRLEVWEQDLGRQASCRKVQTQVTAIGDRAATFSVSVQLDDPLLHSIDELELNQSVTVRNDGSTRSYPRVTVNGPTAAGPKVSIGSWSTTAPRALADGESFVVDTRQGDLFIGGSRVFPILADFPSISDGATVTISTDRGTGTVEGVSAWI